MKKILLLILIGFILASILALSYTIQVSNTFSNFTDDNGNGNEDQASLKCGYTLPKLLAQDAQFFSNCNKTYDGWFIDAVRSINTNSFK